MCKSLGIEYQGLQKNDKSAQSNLGRGPGRGTVAHVRREVPIGYNGVPQMCPQKYPFPWTDCQTPIPASSLDPSDLWCQTASGSNPRFFHNALDKPTDRRTYRPTERPRESLTSTGRCATRATHPNNKTMNENENVLCWQRRNKRNGLRFTITKQKKEESHRA